MTKKTTKAIGDEFEVIAENFLIKNHFNILHKNYHSRFGEIDLIANDKNSLVFVEVKFRKSVNFGQPFEAVTHKKQQKIIRTAQCFLQQHPTLANKACRFDVISIHNQEINWIQNAFDAHC